MSVGLLALLDDVALIARAAAASLDDISAQAIKAGTKSAGIVIDDAAVTPRYVVGLSPARELPIIWRITLGSLRNKLLILLPAALVLSLVAPWAITPILMIGGCYLAYEGAEKVLEAIVPHKAHAHEQASGQKSADPVLNEERIVASAVRTDFILSAEIMAIALSTIPEASFWQQALVLAVVGVGITLLVYGAVALIVKADDLGLALKSRGRLALTRAIGGALVTAMPVFLSLLSIVGTAAMVWVGGGIVIHGLASFGFAGLEHAIHDLAHGIGAALPAIEGLASWLVTALAAGVFGLALGALLIPVAGYLLIPVFGFLKAMIPAKAQSPA